ncbi:iron-containing alcohol dehydrogenase [Thermaurantiacus tibetensis]|uniref:iron-containing alcohol dehydrogenase n=1 Tax=Thermaurantiacus tibetensis TaxID=2759035 RepID=UPI00188EB3F4|nr:iron-containing alcohol dehydrogenase [Thermaurantiacus tibetensis]
MRGLRFRYGPEVVAGPGVAESLAAHLPPGPVLFVTDGQLLGLGLARPALAGLRKAGHDPVVFADVEADPPEATVLAAVAAGRAGGVVSVVGFGGGSPMDVAKLAALLLGSGEPLEGAWGVDQAKGPRLPLLLVPTTAGTGSEATGIAIITVGETEKRGVVSPHLLADAAFLDATLTLGLPRHVTAATGIDAMVHAIEAFTSARLKNPLSDALARETLRLLAANLLRACDAPDDLEARAAMLLGSHLAGVAFANAPVGGVHALAYPLGGHFHVPHGHSNALMLAPVLGHNLVAAAPLYAELLDCLAPGHPAAGAMQRARAFIDRLADLCAATGLPLRLRDVGVTAADLPLLAAESQKQQRLLVNNPVPIEEADARRLYEAAL